MAGILTFLPRFATKCQLVKSDTACRF